MLIYGSTRLIRIKLLTSLWVSYNLCPKFMKLKIVTAFKLKDNRMSSLVDDYVKMIRPFANLELIETPKSAEKKPDDFFKKFDGDFIVGMDPAGRKMDSFQFSSWLEKIFMERPAATFFIGEAEGLNSNVVQRASELISLSDMTMAHRVSLLVLAEQLYRAMTIMKGHPYHK